MVDPGMTSKLADVETLAVRCPNWVGDVVMATPVFDCLRKNLPKARIIGVMKKSARGIVRDGPWFDDVVDVNDKTWSGFRQMQRRLRAFSPDAAILLTNSIRSALTMRLSGIRRHLRLPPRVAQPPADGRADGFPQRDGDSHSDGPVLHGDLPVAGTGAARPAQAQPVRRRGGPPARRDAPGEVWDCERRFRHRPEPGSQLRLVQMLAAGVLCRTGGAVPKGPRRQNHSLLRAGRRGYHRGDPGPGRGRSDRYAGRQGRSGVAQAARETVQPVRHE